MRMRGAILACAVLAGPAWAGGLDCRFTQECLLGEACAATDFAASLSLQSHDIVGDGTDRADIPVLVTDAESVLFFNSDEGSLSLWPRTMTTAPGDPTHVLSITATGDAVYSVVMAEAGLTATYLGRCEGVS